MNNRAEVIVTQLKHALTLIRQAQETRWAELRAQHLAEVERRIETALGLAKEEAESGKA